MRWPGLNRHNRRGWYAATPILMVTAAVQWTVAHPAPSYRGVAVVALQAPKAESLTDDKPNPYSDPRHSLAATAAAVAQSMSGPAVEARLRAAGLVGGYDLEPRNSGTVEEPFFNLPRLDVVTVAGDPAAAIRSVGILVDYLNTDLVGLQDQVGVEPADRVTSNYLVLPAANRVFTSKVRGLFAVTVLGLGTAFLVPRWLAESAGWLAAVRHRPPRRRAPRVS